MLEASIRVWALSKTEIPCHLLFNLDEFYSVRVPIIMALEKLNSNGTLEEVQSRVGNQMTQFGAILEKELLPILRSNHVHVLYNEPVPAYLKRT